MALPVLKYGIPMLTETATIAQATSGSPVSTTATAAVIDARNDLFAGIYLLMYGEHASANGIVTFYFQHSPDGTNWFDLPAVTLTLAGTALVVSQYSWASLNLRGINYLRLAAVGNADTTYDAYVRPWYVRKPVDM